MARCSLISSADRRSRFSPISRPRPSRSGSGSIRGGEVIARDRSKAYADGAHQGAPAATQVADRFHLLQNLTEALDQGFTTHGQVLDAVNDAWRQHPVPWSDGTVAVPVPPPSTPTPARQRAAQRR